MKSPETIVRRPRNRLARETSPYLLQHADNPVDWYPWGEEAFARANAEDKPIFLSVGYSTCYWCHVMERESFADPSVAELMNRHVVSVKVDREERPDVDGIYMTALILMGGRGGWPMSVLLTPDRKPFFGATYIPNAQFRHLLHGVDAAWTDRRAQVLEQAERVAEALAAAGGVPGEPAAVLPGEDRIRAAARQYAEAFDPDHGGFGEAPKFPQPSVLELLMSHFEMTGERAGLSMVDKTLDAMARGGIHDQIGGGFHRYSTDSRWLVPHFEKMLYDQAQLLHAYARAYALTGNAEHMRVAGEIVRYVAREMTGPEGLFCSAQDSEVDGEEGRSYLWDGAELGRLLRDEEHALASRAYGLGAPPNFEGRYILHRPTSYETTARAEGMDPAEALRKLDAIRAKLLAERRKRPQPALDDKSIAAWNGLMIEALAYAGRVTENREWVRTASRSADALLGALRNEGGNLFHVARAGEAKLPAYLDDYAAVILGLIELHRATGRNRWREEADRLGSAMVRTLWDPPRGFRYAAATVEFLIAAPRDTHDGAIPCGNSLAVRALTGLASSGYPRYAPYAAATLKAFEPLLRKAPMALPCMLWGLHEYRAGGLPERSLVPAGPGLPSTAERVRIEGRISPAELSPGEPSALSVSLRIEEGWHVNANPASADSLVPATLDLAIEGGELDFSATYPPGTEISVGASQERIAAYEDGAVLGATVTPVRLPRGNEGRISVSVRVQACDNSGRCLAPATIRTVVPFRRRRKKRKA
jgi:uncharacterized protein